MFICKTMKIEKLWNFLEKEIFPFQTTNFFNQYSEKNPEIDLQDACVIRRNNLKNYLKSIKDPVFLLVGEAPGFKGMRCSGVPFVCEKQLINGELKFVGKQSTMGEPKCENSANIYWKVIKNYNEYILNWDAIPFHPFDLTNKFRNRTPRKSELKTFLPLLNQIIEIIEPEKIISIGRKSEYSLNRLGRNAEYVRHPSYGGKSEFTNGLNKIFKQLRTSAII